jgi:hypothetical protein
MLVPGYYLQIPWHLIINDVGKFIDEMNQHRTQYNNNLTVIAQKINKKQ